MVRRPEGVFEFHSSLSASIILLESLNPSKFLFPHL